MCYIKIIAKRATENISLPLMYKIFVVHFMGKKLRITYQKPWFYKAFTFIQKMENDIWFLSFRIRGSAKFMFLRVKMD